MIERKKPDSLAAEDVANMLNKQSLQWISNVPTEAEELMIIAYYKLQGLIEMKPIEKYLKEKGLIK